MVKVLILFCSVAMYGEAPGERAEKELLSAMNAWKQAMITRDRGALEAMYAPALTYVHSSGKQENKSEAIEAVVNGKDRIDSIDFESVQVSIYNKTAIVKAKLTMRINSGTTINTLNLDVLHVWIKTSSQWQMVARHALRLNPN